MPSLYREQITKTFRDDAIRSVLLIDDDYNPYSDLATRQYNLFNSLSDLIPQEDSAPELSDDIEDLKKNLTLLKEQLSCLGTTISEANSFFKKTSIAAEFVKFFHNEKYICDVEKQTGSLNPDKVRKSDLIILDYCLTGDDSTKSLELLRSLSSSKHLNLVVIYTNQPLARVWIEIASTLRSPKRLDYREFFAESPELLTLWSDAGEVYADCWNDLSRSDLIQAILGKNLGLDASFREQFWQDIQEHEEFDDSIHIEPTDEIIDYLVEVNIRKNNLLTEGESSYHIHGVDQLWIQCGEVFITLCEKSGNDQVGIEQQPQIVWDKLKEALVSWYPNFYRVVLSELQNRIEDSNFSMSKILGKSEHEQVALLWSILKESPERQFCTSESLLRHLLQDISDELLQRDERSAPKFIQAVANSVSENIPEYVAFKKSEPESHNSFLMDTIQLAKENFKANEDEFSNKFCQEIAHAHNELLSTQRTLPSYITTGMVMKSIGERSTSWYICVSPSCDTVPEQETDDCARALSPHRMLSFIKLKKENLDEALVAATQSSHVFVCDDKEGRVALRVVNQHTKQPDLVQFIVHDHSSSPLCKVGKDVTSLSSVKKKKGRGNIEQQKAKLVPVGILKPAYAARFQAVKSHHEGRIGVDFSPADFRNTEEEETE